MYTCRVKPTIEDNVIKLTLKTDKVFYLTVNRYKVKDRVYTLQTEMGEVIIYKETITIRGVKYKLILNDLKLIDRVFKWLPLYHTVGFEYKYIPGTLSIDSEHLLLSCKEHYIKGFYTSKDNTLFVNGHKIEVIETGIYVGDIFMELDTTKILEIIKHNQGKLFISGYDYITIHDGWLEFDLGGLVYSGTYSTFWENTITLEDYSLSLKDNVVLSSGNNILGEYDLGKDALLDYLNNVDKKDDVTIKGDILLFRLGEYIYKGPYTLLLDGRLKIGDYKLLINGLEVTLYKPGVQLGIYRVPKNVMYELGVKHVS